MLIVGWESKREIPEHMAQGAQGGGQVARPASGAVEAAEVADTEPEEVELDLTPATPEGTNDSFGMYLHEMGTVPLLTREGDAPSAMNSMSPSGDEFVVRFAPPEFAQNDRPLRLCMDL